MNIKVIYASITVSVVTISAIFFLLLSLDSLTINKPISKADAIVLVAGNMKERLPVAARLFNEKYAPLIILANGGIVGEWSTKLNRNLLHIELAEERLVKLGVPRVKIVKLPYYGSATMFDALAAKKYIVENNLKKIIVVTSDYHSWRALWTFKYVFKGFDADISIAPAKSFGIGVRGLVLEHLKIGYYLIKFGMLGLVPQVDELNL